MSAIFHFESFLVVVLLIVCTCSYLHSQMPSFFDKHKAGITGLLWKASRIGDRLSPLVSICCIFMAFQILL